MSNSVDFFRYTNGYEDVFVDHEDEFCMVYAMAEPMGWPFQLACRDYDMSDGKPEAMGPWYPVTVHELSRRRQASDEVARAVIREEFKRAYREDWLDSFGEELDDMEMLEELADEHLAA